MAIKRTQTTVNEESDTTIGANEETTLDALCRLDDNSRGEWVRCVCTEVDCDDLRFVFETVHDRTVRKSFRVPRVYEDSDVQRFFKRVGYTAETASVMEGDTFWMKMDDTERVADSPPSRRDSFKDSLKTLLRGDFDLHSQAEIFFILVGGVVLWPIGAMFLCHSAAKKEGWPFALVMFSAIVLTMGTVTLGIYDALLTLVG